MIRCSDGQAVRRLSARRLQFTSASVLVACVYMSIRNAVRHSSVVLTRRKVRIED